MAERPAICVRPGSFLQVARQQPQSACHAHQGHPILLVQRAARTASLDLEVPVAVCVRRAPGRLEALMPTGTLIR